MEVTVIRPKASRQKVKIRMANENSISVKPLFDFTID